MSEPTVAAWDDVQGFDGHTLGQLLILARAGAALERACVDYLRAPGWGIIAQALDAYQAVRAATTVELGPGGPVPRPRTCVLCGKSCPADLAKCYRCWPRDGDLVKFRPPAAMPAELVDIALIEPLRVVGRDEGDQGDPRIRIRASEDTYVSVPVTRLLPAG